MEKNEENINSRIIKTTTQKCTWLKTTTHKQSLKGIQLTKNINGNKILTVNKSQKLNWKQIKAPKVEKRVYTYQND